MITHRESFSALMHLLPALRRGCCYRPSGTLTRRMAQPDRDRQPAGHGRLLRGKEVGWLILPSQAARQRIHSSVQVQRGKQDADSCWTGEMEACNCPPKHLVQRR